MTPLHTRVVEAMARTCSNCRYWSTDDDEDRGSCIILLNEGEARGWRTLPDYTCGDHKLAAAPSPWEEGES